MPNNFGKKLTPSAIRRLKFAQKENETEAVEPCTQRPKLQGLMDTLVLPPRRWTYDEYGKWAELIELECFEKRELEKKNGISVYDNYQNFIEPLTNERDPRCFRKYKPPKVNISDVDEIVNIPKIEETDVKQEEENYFLQAANENFDYHFEVNEFTIKVEKADFWPFN